ncbi:hypothetical protein [Paracoccus salsus]|uniref:hypothetical protein n=1 Tax=Paracoccus salsus TaxID=2911061 RepID=UPI001F374442|nr:hypothetical protein [Paracoccus salsus]MCF3974710.1 hypothetical protein [Paracoccus salsus]
MKTIILTGDSHLGAIRRGWETLSETGKERFAFWPLGKGSGVRVPCHVFNADAGSVTTTPELWRNREFSQKTIAAIDPDAIVVVSLPLNTSRILRDYSWHTHAPWHLATEELALSDQVIAKMIERDSIHAVNLVRDLALIWPALAVVEAPRFFANASYLTAKRLDVCLYVDTVYRQTVRQELAAAGVDVVAQPAATILPQGTTALKYDHPDPADDHHANEAYGRLVLDDIIRYADATG